MATAEDEWRCDTCDESNPFWNEDGRCLRCAERAASSLKVRQVEVAPPPPDDVRKAAPHERREWEVTYLDTGDGHKRRRRFVKWPYAWRFAHRVEREGVVAVHVRDGLAFRSAQLVGIDALYVTASSASGRVCACGCHEPLTTRHRVDARYLNEAHKKRAKRARTHPR
jgi:hypothetical protein